MIKIYSKYLRFQSKNKSANEPFIMQGFIGGTYARGEYKMIIRTNTHDIKLWTESRNH